MSKGFVYILFAFMWFYSGRLSCLFLRNKYLIEKENELREYHTTLLKMAKQLQAKDKTIRKKWQDMVVDMSRYEFANKASNAWTERDDLYLDSWKSAEK